MRGITILFLSVGCLSCTKAKEEKRSTSGVATASAGSGSADARPRTQQVAPPLDLKTPPADATKTASGLVYKKLATNDAGAAIRRNDTVQIHYTGWRQASGETFFTNRARGQPMPLNLSQAAPGFVEGMQLLRQGEKAILWVPPEIGYKTPPADGKTETLVYEVEVVDVESAPAIPDNVAKPPDNARSLPSGTKLVVVRPGTGKDKARSFDTVSYNYTAWTSDGRMVDSSEARKRAVAGAVHKQSPAIAEVLTQMTAGERVRFWADAEKMARGGKPIPGVDRGQLCYELELQQLTKAIKEPPPVPPDVAKPPANAKKTAKGVFYRLLKPGGKEQRPEPTSSVKVHYAGWTTDGKMFDSSYTAGQPVQFSLGGVIEGWKDGIPLMAVGDQMRFWIPEELAYKGQPGKPAGMLVFDVELVEVMHAAGGNPH